MATQVGEATIKLSFDGKTLNASLANAEKEVESGGKKSGSKWANAWSVAAGNLISSGINKVTSAISNNIDNAIARVDTLNNFPKVMRNIGISGDEAEKAISKMADKLQGIPTNLDTAAAAVQRFTSKNSDVTKSTDMFLALNNAMLAGGMSTEMQATALEQISQSYAKGKPDMMEWRSLLQAMPAQARQLAIAMGFGEDGIESLGEALRKGDVTMDDFMNTVIQLNEQGIEGFDNFETQAKNATGGIQSAISIMNSRITQGISAVIDEVGSENITELAIDIGNAFKSVGKTLASVVIFIKDNWGVIKPILIALGTVAGVITTITTAISVWAKVTKAWSAITKTAAAVQKVFSLAMSANPIFLLVGAIVAAVTALVWFFTQTEIGRQIIENFGQVIGEVFGKIGEFFVGIGEKIGAFFQTLFEFVKGIFLTAVQWFVSTIIMPIITNVMAGIELIKGIVATIVGWVDATIVQPIVSFFTGLWDTLVNGVTGAVERIKAVWEGIKNWINTNIVQPIASFFSGLWEGVKKGAEALGEGIGKAMSTIGGLVKAPINAIIDAINGVIDSINSLTIPDWVPGIGGSHTNFGHIPKLAQGGLVSGATNAIIGEAGAEAVIPLERNTENWTRPLATALAEQFQAQGIGGAGVTVYMTNNINNNLDADEIGQRLITSIRRAS